MQSVLPAVYPILKAAYNLDFGQIGLITFANQATASLLQPFVGTFTDASPKPYSLATGMGFTLIGLLLLSVAPDLRYHPRGRRARRHRVVDVSPESSRVARLASGDATASRSRCFRSAATPARRPDRCWRRSSCCPTVSAASPGSASSRSSAMAIWRGRALVHTAHIVDPCERGHARGTRGYFRRTLDGARRS